MIDFMCLYEAYERRKIIDIEWISGKSKLADAFPNLNNVS